MKMMLLLEDCPGNKTQDGRKWYEGDHLFVLTYVGDTCFSILKAINIIRIQTKNFDNHPSCLMILLD